MQCLIAVYMVQSRKVLLMIEDAIYFVHRMLVMTHFTIKNIRSKYLTLKYFISISCKNVFNAF